MDVMNILALVFAPSALLLGAVWLTKNLILARLVRSVQHEFDGKIEKVRSELRTQEEGFKADLRIKEVEIAALQTRAMALLASKQNNVDKRRLEACDELWTEANKLLRFKGLVMILDAIGFEAAANHAKSDVEFRGKFEGMTSTFKWEDFSSIDGSSTQPYISDLIWAQFSTHKTIIAYAFMQKLIITSGMFPSELHRQPLLDMLKTALPHRGPAIDSLPDMIGGKFLSEINDQLLAGLKARIAGRDEDMADMEHAAALLKQIRAVKSELDSTTSPPTPKT